MHREVRGNEGRKKTTDKEERTEESGDVGSTGDDSRTRATGCGWQLGKVGGKLRRQAELERL